MDLGAALRSAFRYVEQHGDPLDVARAELLAFGASAERVVEAYASRQSDRGAFASDPTQPTDWASADVEGSVDALWELSEVGLLGAPIVENAVAYLSGEQAGDGSWGGRDTDLDTSVRLTGMAGGFLARTRWGRPGRVQAAGDFLAEHWSPDRVKGGRWADIASHAHFFANVDHSESDPILQWCGREFERGVLSNQWGPVAAARILVLSDAHALPGAKFDGPDLAVAILNAQATDGCWLEGSDTPEPQRDTATTLSALAALIHFGVRPVEAHAAQEPGSS